MCAPALAPGSRPRRQHTALHLRPCAPAEGIPPFRRCTPGTPPCLDFACDVCLRKTVPTSRLGTPIAIGRPTPFDPLDPYLLAKRLESPPSAFSSGLAESLQQQRIYEEGGFAGYQLAAAAASAPLTPTEHFSPASRDLSRAHTDVPLPMVGGPCTTSAAPEPAPNNQTPKAHMPGSPNAGPAHPAPAAANTAAVWLRLRQAPEQAPDIRDPTHTGPGVGPQTMDIFNPRSAGAPTEEEVKRTRFQTTTADREGYDTHAGDPDEEGDLIPTRIEATDPDGAELFAPAPRTGAVTPRNTPATQRSDPAATLTTLIIAGFGRDRPAEVIERTCRRLLAHTTVATTLGLAVGLGEAQHRYPTAHRKGGGKGNAGQATAAARPPRAHRPPHHLLPRLGVHNRRHNRLSESSPRGFYPAKHISLARRQHWPPGPSTSCAASWSATSSYPTETERRQTPTLIWAGYLKSREDRQRNQRLTTLTRTLQQHLRGTCIDAPRPPYRNICWKSATTILGGRRIATLRRRWSPTDVSSPPQTPGTVEFT